MTRAQKISIPFIVILLSMVIVHSASSQPGPAGRWDGAITLPGTDLGITVQLNASGDSLQGTIDIPQQMAKGLRLNNVGVAGPMVHFTLHAGPAPAYFVGTLAADSISGIFTQGNLRCPFILRRAAALPVAAAPPYRTEEVHIPSGAAVLAGTLSLPAGPGPHPAVVLLTGSGAQDRNEEIFGFAPFKILADSLTLAGFAVLRCDDRGIGGSTGRYAEATTDTFAADARAFVDLLKSRADIRRDAIGVLGHSEGGVATVMLCSASHDIAFAILLAGPAVGGDAIILGQIERLARASGATDSTIAVAKAAQNRVYDAVRANSGWDALRVQLLSDMKKSIAGMTAEQRSAAGITDSVLSVRVDAQMATIRLPWFRRFVTYDPGPDIAKISCPVLAIYGSLDMQVPEAQNRPALASIVAKNHMTNVEIRTVEGANHLFQLAKTGQPSEYATLAKSFVPGMPAMIGSWISRIVLH